MKKILINLAHPVRARSRINNALIKAVEGLDGVTVNDLYARYPDFIIDVANEQQSLLEHDVIIFQHPLYWYSYPSIIKEWLDLVLQHGWAYGSEGDKLANKVVFQTITAGAEDSSYQKRGYNEFTLREFTYSFRAMAKQCKMKWLPPFAVLGIHRGLSDQQLEKYLEEYRQVITAIQENDLDYNRLSKFTYLNSNIDKFVRRT